MKIYFAGALGVEFDFSPLRKEIRNRLVSFYYMNGSLSEKYFHASQEEYDSIIVDSGAFSAWNKGVFIDIEEYMRFCMKNIRADYFVNLDVIPASPGEKLIPLKETERSAEEGFKNYKKLKKYIPEKKLIHVFHQNEDFKWLKRMVDSMDYIGLSPANDRTTREKVMWLDKCMEYILSNKGFPKIKFHGFAVTSLPLMKRYPWYSVDSSTWAVLAGGGGVYIPLNKKNSWEYSYSPMIVHMSSVKVNKGHISFQSELLQKRIRNYLYELDIPTGCSLFRLVEEDYILDENERFISSKTIKNLKLPSAEGDKRWIEIIEEDGIVNNWKYRMFLNALFLNRFAQTRPKWPWSYKIRNPGLL